MDVFPKPVLFTTQSFQYYFAIRSLTVCPSVKGLSGSFPNQNGLKQGDVLSPLLFNFALKNAIKKVQEDQVGLNFNGTQQLLDYDDDVNLLGDNIDTIKKTQKLVLMLVRRLV
jgi:hypothetical protein